MYRLMIGFFEGTIRGRFEEKQRGEYRLMPGKVRRGRIDTEKVCLRLCCLVLVVLVVAQNVFGLWTVR